MSKVIIKTIKRKTTISKSAINKAAKIAYGPKSTTGWVDEAQTKDSAKPGKAA